MKRVLKKYLIPHPDNNHQPHILRFEKILFFISAIVLIESIFLISVFFVFPKLNFFAAIFPHALVDETNANRIHASLPSLTTNSLLEKAAQLKAQDMASKGYFAHTSPEGITPWHWLQEVNYEFAAAGENLAVNFFDSKDVARAWMNSPTHRANILNEKFTEIGIAIAQGTYKGKEAIFVVQFFGRPIATQTFTNIPLAPITQTQAPPAQQNIIPPAVQGQELFIEIKNDIIPAPALAHDTAGSNASTFKRIASAPRFATNFIYITLASIITLALMLKIFIKINIQYPRLIGNGIFVLIVITSSLLLNYYISLQAHII